jgi:hypothetical protein
MSCIASSAVGQVIGLGRQPVAHERHRRGVISGVDGGLADVPGWRAAAASTVRPGEADGGARLAAWRWLRSGACGEGSK